MPKKEKFGKFVLLDEVETSGLGTEYRAAKLSPAGLEKIVAILRVRPHLSARAETVKSLMEQVKFAAQLQNANIVKLFGAGKIDASFYISHEFIEAKSLQAVFNRGRQEGFPFSVDHALLIVSKVCSALEYAHARIRLLAGPRAGGGWPHRRRGDVPRAGAGGGRRGRHAVGPLRGRRPPLPDAHGRGVLPR